MSMFGWLPSTMLTSARSKSCKCGYRLTSKLVASGEQIFGKQSAEISISSSFPCNDNLTRSHRCFVKRSSPKVFRLSVSVFVGTRPSFSFSALVTYERWLPLSNKILTGTGFESFVP